MMKDQTDQHTLMVFEYYRQRVIKLQFEVPHEIPKTFYEADLPIDRSAAMNTLLVKEI